MAQQPCPNSETCCGTIQLHPDVNVEEEHEIIDGRECVTSITVTCCIIAECSNCTYVALVDQERRSMTFDQFYHPQERLDRDLEFFFPNAEEVNRFFEGA